MRTPCAPVCSELGALIQKCASVREVGRVWKEHKKSCFKCGDLIRMPARQASASEPGAAMKEAA